MEDKDIGYEARQTWEGDGPVTVIRYKAEGFTKETWKTWAADPIGVQCKLNDIMTATPLENNEDMDGHPTFHLHMKMPMMISNRSVVTSFYEEECEDGSLILINSSQGNEAIIEEQKKLIGKNVVANAIITYTKGEFYDGGCNLVQVISMNVNGMIPNFVQKKIAKRLADTTKHLVAYLLHGTIPKSVF